MRRHGISFESEKYGYHFRSWLERKWATFYAELRKHSSYKMFWDYEPEGYLLPNGDGYRPDFLLSYALMYGARLDTHFVEIKPSRDTYIQVKDKIDQFIFSPPETHSAIELSVVVGHPGSEEVFWFINSSADFSKCANFFDPPYIYYGESSSRRQVWSRHFVRGTAWKCWVLTFEKATGTNARGDKSILIDARSKVQSSYDVARRERWEWKS